MEIDFQAQKAAADLVWYWNNSDGEMGLQSNFGPMVNRLNGMVANMVRHDADPARLEAAARAGRIIAALQTIGVEKAWLLRLTFAQPDEGQPYETDLAPLGHLAGIALVCAASTIAHRKSKSSRPMREWLARLFSKKNLTIDDMGARTEIRHQAEVLLTGSLDAFARAHGRRQ